MTSTVLPAGLAYVVPITRATRQHDHRAYDTVLYQITPGHVRQGFRLVCASCDTVEDVSNEHDCSPAHVTTKFERRGWRVNSTDRRRCFCPKCATKHKPTPQPTTEQPKMTEPPPKFAPGAKPNGATPPRPPALVLQSLTTEKRVRIRGKLDGHFDDARGAYIDGYSDQRIAEEVDVPRAVVVAMREAAYGQITADPEIDALRVALESETRKGESQLSELMELRDQVASRADEVMRLKQRLTALERRLIGG